MANYSSLRKQALHLYRRILRVGRSWNSNNPENTKEERRYILDETKHWFTVNKTVKDEQAMKDHLQEGEARLEMGIFHIIF